jgi:hypothetical protein
MVLDSRCGDRIYRRLIARDNAKSAAMAAKECVQVIEATHVASERCRRRYDAQLIMVRVETKPVEQHPQEIGDFSAWRAAICVKLIDYKMEEVAAVARQPSSGCVEDGRLNATHKHNIEHAVVRDEDVGRLVLHVPA